MRIMFVHYALNTTIITSADRHSDGAAHAFTQITRAVYVCFSPGVEGIKTRRNYYVSSINETAA